MSQPYTPYVADCQTSMDAALSVVPIAKSLKAKVREYIVQCGADGATDDEVQVALSMPAHTAVPRRIDLVRSGEVVDSQKTRKTRAGRDATVWVLKDFARPEGLPSLRVI